MDGFIQNKNYVNELAEGFLDDFLTSTEDYCKAYLAAVNSLEELEKIIEKTEKNSEEINELTEKLVFADTNLKSEAQKRDLKRRLYIDVANRYGLELDEDFTKISGDFHVLKEKYHKTVADVLQKHNELCDKDKRLKTFAMVLQDIDPLIYEEGRTKFMSLQAKETEKAVTNYLKNANKKIKDDIDKAYQ